MTQRSLSDSLVAALGRIADREHQTEASKKGAPPFNIALSREPGAKGTEVARAVGQRLGWQVYDQELVELVAREMGTHVDMLRLLDEKPMSWLEQCVVSMVSQYNLNHDSYMVHLIAAIRSLGERGRCIIVGRGANFILPPGETLHIRLVGELRDRVAHMRKLKGTSERDAEHWVEKTAQERKNFVRKYFGKDVTDPEAYELVVNTSRLTVAECADVIVDLLHRLQARPRAALAESHAPART
jgi:cytidylate kinase